MPARLTTWGQLRLCQQSNFASRKVPPAVYHGRLVSAPHGGLGMDRWDVIIILAAGYVALMTLVRLMARRRNQSLERFNRQVAEQMGKQPKKISNNDQTDQEDRGAA